MENSFKPNFSHFAETLKLSLPIGPCSIKLQIFIACRQGVQQLIIKCKCFRWLEKES